MKCNRWKSKFVKNGILIFVLVCLLLSMLQRGGMPTITISLGSRSTYEVYGLQPTEQPPEQVASTQVSVSKQASPRNVVMLTHQRCGSSFFGKIFNFNPDVFYLHEPLDALYTSFYGTFPGWNVASDIFSNEDGTKRELPSYEIDGVADFMNNLLTCRVENLPTEALIHNNWEQFWYEMNSAGDYSGCVNKKGLVDTNHGKKGTTCSELLKDLQVNGVYERRFRHGCNMGDELCYRLLHDFDYIDPNATTNDKAMKYKDCLEKRRSLVDQYCSSSLKSACSSRSIRVVKVVRGTMQSMEKLLQKVPDLRVIHLIRDPRGVVLSRLNFCPSIRGRYAKAARGNLDYLAREAKLYCQQMAADIRIKKQLEKQFPGQLYTLYFEQIAEDPVGKARDIYRFIGEADIPSKTLQKFIFEAGKGSGNVSGPMLASAWQKKLKPDEKKEIVKQCGDLFQLVPEYAKTN